MRISDILKQQGLFSQDIKTRFNNGQIIFNGEIQKQDIEIDCLEIIDAGDFVFELINNKPIWKLRLSIIGLENLFNSNIENDLTEFLKNFSVLKISKKQIFVLRKM